MTVRCVVGAVKEAHGQHDGKHLHSPAFSTLIRSRNSNDHPAPKTAASTGRAQKCLAIRSVVGRNGYEYLRTMKYPLPSYRTLCCRIQSSSFAPGIQHDVLEWLHLKLEHKGWTVAKVFYKVTCDVCQSAFVSDDVSDEHLGQFTAVMHNEENLNQTITQLVLDVIDTSGYQFPRCHNILPAIIKKFIHLGINEQKTAYRITLVP